MAIGGSCLVVPERAAAPTVLEKTPAVEDSKLITETVALSSDNLMYSKLIAIPGAAPTADNLFDSKYFTETAVPSSNNLPHAEAAAPIADNLFDSKYSTETHNLPKYFTETAAPSSHNLSHTDAAVPTADINLFDSKLTETAAPSSHNLSHMEAAAPTADNLFDSKFTETAAPSSHKPSHTEAAAPTLETRFSDNGIKEAEAPTAERGIFPSKIAEAVAPSSEKGAFVGPITEITAPSVENGFFHYKIKGAAPSTSERGASDCKITEAGVPTSEKGLILYSITEIMLPTFKNGVTYYQNKDPTSERGVSHCKVKGTGVHTAEEGVIYNNSITKIPAPTLQNGAFYYQNKCTAAPISERGVSQCKIKGVGAHTAEEGVFSNSITKTAAPSALGNGVCSEDSAAPTSERGFSHYKISETGVCTSEKEVFLKSATETSENGVSYYQPGFPDVLRPPSPSKQIAHDSKVSLYAYIIHYLVLQEGQDPINITPPTEFVLLNHFLLDEEVAHHFSVRLNLPHQECVTAHLTPCDMISFTLDQVNIIEVFNGMLFSIVRLRSKLDFENFYTVENKTKGYYVMPLKDGVDLRTKAELIDWTTVFDLVHCKLNMKERMHHHATLGPDTNSYFLNDTGALVKGWLRLKCGVYKEEDLIDAFVTYGPFNTSCFIVEISDELCGLSIMQGSDCCLSYKDYWLKRFEVELKYASQRLLVGYCLSHAGNFLQRPSQADLDPPNISVHQKLFGAKQKQRESLFLQKSVFYRQNLRAIYGGELFVYRQFFVH